MEGDTIRIEAAGVRVNGRLLANSAQLPTDRDGLPLPQSQRWTNYSLKAGEILTMSTYNPRSFDSRYFGLVPRSDILSVVEPLLLGDSSRACQTTLMYAESMITSDRTRFSG